MKTYTVADGVEWINGAPVPESREVDLSEAEALYDLALGRIREKPARRTKAKPVSEEPAD